MGCKPRITRVHTNPPFDPWQDYPADVVRWFIDLANDGTSAPVVVNMTLSAPLTGQTTVTNVIVTPPGAVTPLGSEGGTAFLEYDLSVFEPGEVKISIACIPQDPSPDAVTAVKQTSLVFA